MTDRRHDLVLFGATGFTGALAAAHLASRIGDRPWAIAGRDGTRLGTIAGQLVGTRPDVVVADVGDRASLDAMARDARVVATTVGPYAQLGRPVVEACLAAGTEYADITGEPAFVDGVRRDLDAAAVEAGVRLVSCCGFDSVPHDLAVHHAVGLLPDQSDVVARGYVTASGSFSGGTFASAVGAMRGGLGGPAVPRRDDGTGRRTGGLRPTPGRVRGVPGVRGVALPMPTIDPQVVLRSAALLPRYGRSFRYAHHLVVPNAPAAAGLVAGVGVVAGLARLPVLGEPALTRLFPARGEGPSNARRARSWFRVTVVAEASTGERALATASGGDPGYDETAVMLGEVALGLLNDDVEPRPGAVTPAVALGDVLRARLVGQGQQHEARRLDADEAVAA